MATNMFIPPWMQVQYNPVHTFLQAFQTGAQIRQAQTKLAEEQRQANMQAQARQEQLQQNALLEAARIQTEKSYRQQQAQLQQAQLMETAKRTAAVQADSLKKIEETARHNRAMEEARKAQEQRYADQAAAKAGASRFHFGENGEITEIKPDGTVVVLRPPNPPATKSGLRITKALGEEGDRISGTPEEVEAYTKAQEEAKAKEKANKEPSFLNKTMNTVLPKVLGVMNKTGQFPIPTQALPFRQTSKKPSRDAINAAYEQANGDKEKTKEILKAQGYEF